MRKYKEEKERRLEEVVCNKCGRLLKVENGILKEGCFTADAFFGYFSKKDGVKHQFDLCEDCYDALIGEFSLPVCETEEEELC